MQDSPLQASDRLTRRLQDLSPSTWQTIARIDELKGRWVGSARLNPAMLGRLRRSVLVTSTGASTRIEGAQATDEEVERLIRGLSLRRLADRDAQEVRGYYEALQFVFDSWPELSLTENHIKQLHTRMLQYVEKDVRHRGEYKTMDNRVEAKDPQGRALSVLFDTTPPYLTAKEMSELVTWTNAALAGGQHPLLVIGSFVVEFLKIHPFLDGNGRLSRLLANLLMLRAGYAYVPYVSHEHLIEARKADYYLALRRSQVTFGTDADTVEPWLTFFTNVCLAQAIQAEALLSGESLEQSLSPSQLKVWHYLAGGAEVTPRAIASGTGVPRRTVNQVLDKLLRLERIDRLGQGRATRYRARESEEGDGRRAV